MRIYARDCTLKSVSKDDYKSFVLENHSQGYAYATDIYGLYYKDELVQLMSFSKPRFNKSYSWEIIRDCTKKNYQIIGGVSKIWRYFVDEKDVNSCICYSYPHDINDLYTDKYVKHCGFINLKRAKPERKVYFEGVWNGELKRIDKSILERHGANRLLGGSFGQDRTNEQILIDLGFERKEEDGFSPQIDSYFPFGVLYKITDEITGQFYIGKCESKRSWDRGYMGSGSRCKSHMNAHPDHTYTREILRERFRTPRELHKAEEAEIRKYCEKIDGIYKIKDKDKCLNIVTYAQGTLQPCKECGGMAGHKTTCSKYKPPKPCEYCGSTTAHKNNCPKRKEIKVCPECGGKGGRHYKSCSSFNRKPCGYCGSTSAHKSDCPKYKKGKVCKYCGSSTSHKSDCPLSNKKDIICEYCGSRGSRHKKYCIKNKNINEVKYVCVECREVNGKHKKSCSHREPIVCPECGGKEGLHKDFCSKSKGRCPECGYSLTSHRHAKTCSHYRELKESNTTCLECGGKRGIHKKTCSKYISSVCDECGRDHGHYKTCSKYKAPDSCPECGRKYGHKKGCSQYKANSCPECGGTHGHKKTCSKYVERRKCPECGGGSGNHFSTCSKYKPSKVCPECGLKAGHHKRDCSHKKR